MKFEDFNFINEIFQYINKYITKNFYKLNIFKKIIQLEYDKYLFLILLKIVL